MRVDNWDTKLSNYIVEQSKTKFVRGKTDCVNFILRWNRGYNWQKSI